MARKYSKGTRFVALRSFDLVAAGEEFEGAMTPRARNLVAAGYLKVVGSGQSEARSGAIGEGDSGGSPEDAASEGTAGAEQGEDPGSGGHGTVAE